MRSSVCSLLVASLIVLSAAASSPAVYPEGYDPRYVQAVNETKQPLTFRQIDYNLTTITGSGPVLMTCFTDWAGYSRAYDGTTQNRPKLWTTAAPELWQFFQDNNVAPQDMSLRTKQLLGLPADNKGYFVMEFYVQPSSLFRPAMDPDITDPVTSLTFQGQMADPNSAMRQWFDANFSTYNPPKPVPWTRAGYTYDWGSDDPSHIGLTEFITDDQTATKSNPISVRSVISLISYKYYVRDLDAFNVTDACDTLWLGSKFLPVTAGGNWVNIHSGVLVSGGEGITVTDLDNSAQPSNWTITNAGTIQGPGVSHDGTPRDSSVWFTNTGGILNNIGTITGDKIGVLGSDTCTRPIVVNNTGTIRGSQFAIRTGGGDDTITTSGLIDGNINTGPGNDTINICGGTVTGSIDGGTGTNRLNFNLPGNQTFTLDHDILEMAEVNIQSGTVRLQGQVSGAVTVDPGAVLGGNCTLLGSLNNNGYVSPGDSIGTITIKGNYTQSAGSRYLVEVAKPSAGSLTSDHLNVTGTGTATLAAGSYFEVHAGNGSGSAFTTGDSFHVLNAAGGLSDQGAQVTSDSAFLAITGAAVAKDYVLSLRRTATFASAAAPGNNAAMAAALDADTARAGDGYAGLIDQLMFTSAAGFNSSLHQLSPAAYLTVDAATDRTTQYMAEALAGYLRNRRAGQINPVFQQTSSYQSEAAFAQAVGSLTETADVLHYCAGGRDTIDELRPTDRTRSVWVNPFGLFFGESTAGDHLGFQSNTAGVQFGIDKQFDEHWIMGIGGGYDQSHVDTGDLLSAGEIETFRIGPYASWFNDDWYLDLSLTGGFHDNSLGRVVDVGGTDYIARGDYHAQDFSFYMGGGRDCPVGDYTFSPLVSLQYIAYRQDGFEESGGDGAGLLVDPRNANSLRSRVGGQVRRVYRRGAAKIVPELFAGWAHEYLANDPLEARFLGGVTPFSIDRGGIFRDAGYFGANVTLLPREHAALFVRYDGEFSDGGHFNAVDLGAMFEF